MLGFRIDTWETARSGAFRILRRVSERWGLTTEEERRLWGLSHQAHHVVCREKACPPDPAFAERASRIVYAYFYLGCIWPFDEKVQCKWMKRRNWRSPFYGRTPLEFAVRDPNGLRAIAESLADRLIDRGGGAINATSVVFPDELLSLEDEDEDILAEMILRVGARWELAPNDWVRMFGVGHARIVRAASGHQHLGPNATERIIYALSVHGCYRSLISGEDADAHAIIYATTPHRILGNVSPLSLLKTGNIAQMREVAEKAKEELFLYGRRT